MPEIDPRPVTTGGCQCGRVRYALLSSPERPGICHCRMCQRATGNPFHAFVGVAKDQFRWTAEPPKFFASSADSQRGFCAHCGTPLSFDHLPGKRITVGIATLDDPSSVTPDRNIGVESKLAWVDQISEFPGKTTVDNAGTAYVESVDSNQSKIGET